jgi:Bifunctional DNA primase/polymerase, N-terminal
MSAAAASDRISYLLGLLGPAVLLPWPSTSKGDRRKWKHLQLTDMTQAEYLTKLKKAGNIGVALGQVSNGLVTIDLDQDSYVDALLEANPLLKNTLRTRAARGCNVWVRCSGEYPPSQKLKDKSGIELGEWRADGNQTIVTGTHPGGVPYQFVVERPVITVSYNAIFWPMVILPPYATESKRVRRVGEKKVVSVCVDGASGGLIAAFITGDLISQIAPNDFRQNNGSLFKLARLVKTYESEIGRLATQEELQSVFDRWCLLSGRFWRHTRDHYWAEFLEASHYARIGLEQDPLEVAFNHARKTPLPEVIGFGDERVRLVAAISREMQRRMGPNPFFLPTRKLGGLLGASWSSVAAG